MSPREYIRDLCKRYGVSKAFGDRLLPLAEQAEMVDPEMRRRLHEFLERSFLAQVEVEAEEAERGEEPPLPPEEQQALNAVATVLHGWEPPSWLRLWAERMPPPEEEPKD